MSKKLQQIYKIEYQIFCQNGKDAGQTVPHCHLHLIPKKEKDESGLERQEDKVRSEEDMGKEADSYRNLFEQGSS